MKTHKSAEVTEREITVFLIAPKGAFPPVTPKKYEQLETPTRETMLFRGHGRSRDFHIKQSVLLPIVTNHDMIDSMPNVQDKLKAAMAAGGQSLNALARASGLNPSQLSRFMTGERGLTLDSAERIADALGLKLSLTSKESTTKRRR